MTTIDPMNITDYNRGERELQTFWLFCISVAGKNSDVAAKAVDKILRQVPGDTLPFDYFYEYQGMVHNILVTSAVGQYTRIEKAILETATMIHERGTNLRTCSLNDLMSIFGVGPKTARFFLVHTRKNAQHVVLDTHILSWLRKHHATEETKTPQTRAKYENLEQVALGLYSHYFPGMTVAQVDLLIWAQESGRLEGDEFLHFQHKDGVL